MEKAAGGEHVGVVRLGVEDEGENLRGFIGYVAPCCVCVVQAMAGVTGSRERRGWRDGNGENAVNVWDKGLPPSVSRDRARRLSHVAV
jgi:hypothetical protein